MALYPKVPVIIPSASCGKTTTPLYTSTSPFVVSNVSKDITFLFAIIFIIKLAGTKASYLS